ncbi:unnamed protein product [Linum trigynum]|uniref:Uncharacterized protein n=1 Tax=Linum trigynum TaxID=586398 RepID=A0AAV2CM50_9ROSI
MEAAAAQRRGTERESSEAAAVNEGGELGFVSTLSYRRRLLQGPDKLEIPAQRSCASRLLGVLLTVSVGKG